MYNNSSGGICMQNHIKFPLRVSVKKSCGVEKRARASALTHNKYDDAESQFEIRSTSNEW